MTENFPEFMKTLRMQIQNTYGNPSRKNTKKTTPSNSIIKLMKTSVKEKFIKAARHKIHIR